MSTLPCLVRSPPSATTGLRPGRVHNQTKQPSVRSFPVYFRVYSQIRSELNLDNFYFSEFGDQSYHRDPSSSSLKSFYRYQVILEHIPAQRLVFPCTKLSLAKLAWLAPSQHPSHWDKVGHLQPIYLCLSRLGCSLGELQVVRPDKFCQA